MTQTSQREPTATKSVSGSPRDTSMSPPQSLRPTTDSLSDNDNSEKPVREKLKKTSLASMSHYAIERQERALREDEENSDRELIDRDSSLGESIDKETIEPRGRPVKKRSFDDLDTPEAESVEAGREHVAKTYANGHLRKRSRDVRVGEGPTENRRPLLVETPVREESEDAEKGPETSDAYINGPENVVDCSSPAIEAQSQVKVEQDQKSPDLSELTQPVSGTVQGGHIIEIAKESADQEMRGMASIPQKKRSRDQFDTEADREQKIAATEEARAHRRSDELERSGTSANGTQSPVSAEGSVAVRQQPVTVEEEKGLVPHLEVERQGVGLSICQKPQMLKPIQSPFKGAFGSSSAFSPSNLARSDPSAKFSSLAAKTTHHESQRSADAFASSGFAALAGSSASPFGILRGPSTAATASPFTSAGYTSRRAENGLDETLKPEAASNGGFSTFASNSSTPFGSTDQSLLGSSGSNKTSVFGGSVFGSSFGGPLGGASRLTSFAAPTGDAKLGFSNGALQPIGSPKRDPDEDEKSESEAEGAVESKKDAEIEEADGRFQHQDGKHNCR